MKKGIFSMRRVIAFLLAVLIGVSVCSCDHRGFSFGTKFPSPDSDIPQETNATDETQGSSNPEEPTPSETVKQSSTINGAPLSDWVIGVNPQEKGAVSLAEELVDFFFKHTKEHIKIVTPNTATGDAKNIIAIGALGRSVSVPDYFDGEYYVSKQDETGSVISMMSSKTDGLQSMVDLLLFDMQQTPEGDCVSFTISQREHIRFFVEDEIPVWNLQTETKTELYDGVTYIKQRFLDENNNPYRTYALILDPDRVVLHMGSSNDGYELVPTERQTTLQHMQAAIDNGKNIIAAVNANFFDIDGDYSPNGLALKDGVQINASRTDLPFFAVTEDGEIIIDEGWTYNDYVNSGKNFVQGVAAGPILLTDGLLIPSAKTGAAHPRTLAGVTADGKIVFGVIDGRQEQLSNGATHARSALWMRSLGVVTAINLDGGGSSTFVLRDPETNHCGVYNSPSDGKLRKVYNSVLIEWKED